MNIFCLDCQSMELLFTLHPCMICTVRQKISTKSLKITSLDNESSDDSLSEALNISIDSDDCVSKSEMPVLDSSATDSDSNNSYM